MLSEREYIRFQKARQSSFISRSNTTKFRQWILNEDKHIDDIDTRPQPNMVAWEIMQHLAYELVGTIVDLVFQIRQQQKPLGEEPNERLFITESLPASLTVTAILPQVNTCSMSSPFLIPEAQHTTQVEVGLIE
jgi:hypothetical protein